MKKFSLSYTIDVMLNAEDLWPDGDGPADPTEADVLQLIAKCGGIRNVIEDWNLDPDGDGHLDVHAITSRG